MILKSTVTNAMLLAEARFLVARAVKRGWMSYPASVKVNEDGDVIDTTETDYLVTTTVHTPEICRKAYVLRDRGLTLEDVAKACGVARGSVAYIVAKGHEQFLHEQRLLLNNNNPLSSNTTSQEVS